MSRCSVFSGGSSAIADGLFRKLKRGRLVNGARVTAIRPPGDDVSSGWDVTVAGESAPRHYDHVISTLPFGCLRFVDTSSCGFSWSLQTAIRSLGSEESTKIAMRFKHRWWEEGKFCPPQMGGVSYTDRPIRMVAYPSYDMGGKSATLIVSYSWGLDSERLDPMNAGRGTLQEGRLRGLILKDLADLHGIEDDTYLFGLFEEMDVWSWGAYENSAGMSSYSLAF